MSQQLVEGFWQRKTLAHYLLLPLCWSFRLGVGIRTRWYAIRRKEAFNVPIIVVGNLSVGGNGKTPALIAMAKFLQEQGYKPGIVSRGYGGKSSCYPLAVKKNSLATEVGDEPLMIAEKTRCPTVVSPKRVEAVHYLLKNYACDVVLSDDGLQHYALSRDIEIALLGSRASLGNGWCLPVGPLRESMSRLKTVDFILGDASIPEVDYSIRTNLSEFSYLKSGENLSLDILKDKKITAIAGIAQPQRFFNLLAELGLEFDTVIYPDHHQYCEEDLKHENDSLVLMTEKDAIKCREFAHESMIVVKIETLIATDFWPRLLARLTALNNRI